MLLYYTHLYMTSKITIYLNESFKSHGDADRSSSQVCFPVNSMDFIYSYKPDLPYRLKRTQASNILSVAQLTKNLIFINNL